MNGSQDNTMNSHTWPVSLGITLFSALPIVAETAQQPSETNVNWSIVLSVLFFVLGQGINLGWKIYVRRANIRDRINALHGEDE